MEYRGTGRKIYDGSETGVPYLHGAPSCAKTSPSNIPRSSSPSSRRSTTPGEWIKADPMRAVENMEKWSGVEKEVLYLYFSKGGHLTLDPTIKPKWIEPLKFDHCRSREGAGDPAARFQRLGHRGLRQGRLPEARSRL